MPYDLPQAGPSQPVAPYVGSSQAAYGTATTPGAGAAIATLTPSGGPFYDIRATACYGATADVLDNMDLRVNGVSLGKLIVHPVANGQPVPNRFPRVQVAAGQAVTVNAVAGGGAGSIFRAQIVATPVP